MNHIERRHAIDLPLPVDRAFPLFTPAGEISWVADWDPQFLHPESGATQEGMVFRTEHGGETTFWACIVWEPSTHHARYARVTPASRFGFVDVSCHEPAPEITRVTVTYAFTALSHKGEADLEQLTDHAFREMIDGWRDLIVSKFCSRE